MPCSSCVGVLSFGLIMPLTAVEVRQAKHPCAEQDSLMNQIYAPLKRVSLVAGRRPELVSGPVYNAAVTAAPGTAAGAAAAAAFQVLCYQHIHDYGCPQISAWVSNSPTHGHEHGLGSAGACGGCQTAVVLAAEADASAWLLAGVAVVCTPS